MARRTSAGSDGSEPSDEELMERFCGGDAASFDVLFTRHGPPLHGFFRRMTRSDAVAEDLLQVTFLHLVKARGRYAPGEPLSPWLYAIARNAARDYLRLARHRIEQPQSDDAPEVAAPAAEAGPEQAELQALKAALDELPPAYREAVVMHQLQGLSFAEIAATLGSTPGAVKVRAHRGYQKLREKLASLGRGKP